MRNRTLFIFAFNLLQICIFQYSCIAQVQSSANSWKMELPLEIPPLLAGNFGEPRANHFHSGLDFKTNGNTGIPVHAVANGYISRIKVETGGYGLALYIRHPEGFTSVYAHLDSFVKEIGDYVRNEQYRRESFAVDLFPEASRFPVSKSETVAFSGNSGSSEGPHLHFEVRETQSENPVNPLIGLIGLKDDIPPVMEKIHLYSLKDKRKWIRPLNFPLKFNGGNYIPVAVEPAPLDDCTGIAIQTYDLLNGSGNRCGVYHIQGYLDGKLFFESSIDDFSFAETRYMNSFMDYSVYMENRKPVLKLFIEPNNQASIYRFAANRGKIEIKDNQIHEIRIVVWDAAGNHSTAIIKAKLQTEKFIRDPAFLPLYDAYFNYGETNRFTAENIELTLPSGSLYDDIYFTYLTEEARAGCYSPLHILHDIDVPIHQYCRLAIRPANLPPELMARATIAQIARNGRYVSLGGSWEGDWLVARTRSFGSFCIRVDTVKPEIRPMNFSASNDLKSIAIFKFTAKDDFSGIQSYRGTIDDKWILLEYDPKNNLLQYKFDQSRIKTGSSHRLSIKVADQMGNRNEFSTTFFR